MDIKDSPLLTEKELQQKPEQESLITIKTHNGNLISLTHSAYSQYKKQTSQN